MSDPTDAYPDNKNLLFYSSLGLSFVVSFIIYLFTLAPTVTLEDSGELITAAYRMGIPHVPGYPLFTMLGKLFSFLPVGDVAYRLNLMSAFFSSLGALFLCWTVILLIENSSRNFDGSQEYQGSSLKPLKYAAGFAAGMLMSFSYETWEQSIITEVYALHCFFISIFLFYYALFKRQASGQKKRKYSNILFLITGLSFTNHSTTLFLLLTFVCDLLITDTRFLFKAKTLYQGALFGLTGLLPLVYLPIASLQNPVIDWGNPENLTNFIKVITRHDTTFFSQTIFKYLAELSFYFNRLLIEQWIPFFLLLLIPAFIFLYKRNKNFAVFSLIYLFFTIPVSVFAIDFNVIGNDINSRAAQALVSVYYIPSYIMIALLMGTGLYFLGSLSGKRRSLVILSLLIVLMPLLNIFRHYKRVDMHDFHYAEYFDENIFKMMPENALLITNVDYIYFPIIYFQYVEGKRTDMVVLDKNLLTRSWYLEMLRVNHPDLINKSENEVQQFLRSVEPFEKGLAYEGSLIQRDYDNMVNSFIDKEISQGKDVYFAYLPGKEIIRDYKLESIVTVFRMFRDQPADPVDMSLIRLDEFKKVRDNSNFFLYYLMEYYLEMLLTRAMYLEVAGNSDEAISCYSGILEFKSGSVKIRDYAANKIEAHRANQKEKQQEIQD